MEKRRLKSVRRGKEEIEKEMPWRLLRCNKYFGGWSACDTVDFQTKYT
jgi:hypothetical protein